jgi:hypothetical protein
LLSFLLIFFIFEIFFVLILGHFLHDFGLFLFNYSKLLLIDPLSHSGSLFPSFENFRIFINGIS